MQKVGFGKNQTSKNEKMVGGVMTPPYNEKFEELI
jgi:hypothetical protein